MLTPTEREARLKLVEEHVEAENDHDIERIVATFGTEPEFVLNGMRLTGKDQIRDLYGGFGFGGKGSFSNLRANIVHRHIGGNPIVLEVMLSGKHTANFQNIAPTGKTFEIPVCAIFTFDPDGRLAGERVYFDGSLLLKQLELKRKSVENFVYSGGSVTKHNPTSQLQVRVVRRAILRMRCMLASSIRQSSTN